jgi:hypothetical protein
MAQRDEVEEFLRRAAARRAAAQAQGQGQAPFAIPPRQPPPTLQPPLRPLTTQEVVMLQPVTAPVEAEVIEPELVEVGDSVSQSVLEHMRGTQEIGNRVRQLGQEVDQADEKLEAHLQQVFDHRVGQLKVRSTESPRPPVPQRLAPAAFSPGDIAQMLLSPASVRSAIILGEVLKRPEFERTKLERTKEPNDGP